MGDALARLGRGDDARDAYAHAIQIDPQARDVKRKLDALSAQQAAVAPLIFAVLLYRDVAADVGSELSDDRKPKPGGAAPPQTPSRPSAQNSEQEQRHGASAAPPEGHGRLAVSMSEYIQMATPPNELLPPQLPPKR